MSIILDGTTGITTPSITATAFGSTSTYAINMLIVGGGGCGGSYGGGGGGGGITPGAGGSGIVIISYQNSTQLGTGGTATSYTSNGVTYWVHAFTSSSSYVA